MSKFVHTLVAQTYVENSNPEKYDKVHHIDFDHHNNHFENLEWANLKIIVQKRLDAGFPGGCKPTKIKILDIEEECMWYFDNTNEAAEFLGVTTATINMACNGKIKLCQNNYIVERQENKVRQDNDFDDLEKVNDEEYLFYDNENMDSEEETVDNSNNNDNGI